ncbi:MAG: Uma2 family endonuclease [Chloroflexi bacterium]|nr:Uma2 family endonuclease [Chloroflexota bacterium]
MAIAQVRTFPTPERPAPGPWKPADLERFPDDGYQYEIWHGELVRMAPAGGRHGECEANVVSALHTQLGTLGRVYTGDTGFILRERPTDLVSPDVAFVRHDRLPPADQRVRFLKVVPDLAVEIRSPSDNDADVRAKVELYMNSGVRLVWLVDPRTRRVEEVRPAAGGSQQAAVQSRVRRAEAGDVLEDAQVLPGFRLSLAAVFA